MRFMLLAWVALSIGCTARPETEHDTVGIEAEGSAYDAALAERLGADEYGMRRYTLALASADEDAPPPGVPEKDLFLYGPFAEGPLRYLYIAGTDSTERDHLRRELMRRRDYVASRDDPQRKEAGWSNRKQYTSGPADHMGIFEWYGSAALSEIGRLHDRIAEKELHPWSSIAYPHRSIDTTRREPSGSWTLHPSPGPFRIRSPFDSTLASRLGADQYGMRRYVLALLKPGPNRGQDSAAAAALQRAHRANIGRMAEAGQLVLAGPFLDGDYQGLYVFDVETVEEARALTETDPAVQAGRLAMELHPWYGSAALREVNAIHKRLARESP